MADARIHFPGPGCIVEFMQGNKAVQAWVLEVQGGTVRLLSEGRRESKLSTSRLLPWLGPQYSGERSKQDMADFLTHHRTVRERWLAEIDINEIWEMAQGELEQAQAQWLAELMWAGPDADQVAAMGHAALGHKTHFKFSPPIFEIHDEEKVNARLTEQENVRRREEFSVTGAEYFRTLWEIYCHRKETLAPSDAPPPELLERLSSIILERLADPEAHDHDGLWKLLTKGLPEDPHMALFLAQAAGLVQEHHNFWLNRAGYDASPDWAARFTSDIESLVATVTDAIPQTDDAFEPTAFVTIDAETTADRDDAIFVQQQADGSFRVRMAFACPAAFWPFGSTLDKAVLHRGTSIYLPEGDCHMLPEAAGLELFSLEHNVPRRALLVDMDVSAEGVVTQASPRIGWVRIAANVTFTGCQAVLDATIPTGDSAHSLYAAALPYGGMLDDALALAKCLQQKRIADGAVISDRPDPHIALETAASGETLVSIDIPPACPDSQMIVGECMILANNVLAAWAIEHDVPLIFRTQDVALPKEFAGIWTDPADMARVIKHLPPSVYELSPRPHAGVGVPVYAPVTSPLRRYTDLVNEAQIVHYLEAGQARLDSASLTSLLPQIVSVLDLVGQVQRFRPRYWKLLYFRQQGDKVWWDAVVTEENDYYVTVSIPLIQINVRAKSRLFDDKVHAGQSVQVRIGKVHPLRNEIAILETREL